MATATINGMQMAYRDEGRGQPLLLIHAFPLNARMWEPQFGFADRGWHVIAPQLRGFAESSKDEVRRTKSEGTTTIDDYAGDVIDLLDALHRHVSVDDGLTLVW